jgi:hypothetical protein
MFEILTALAFLTFSAAKEEFEEARSGTGGQRVAWSLISRVSFDRENRDFILSNLKQPEMRAAMLKAGFSSKDEAHMTLAIESVWRLMALMQRY